MWGVYTTSFSGPLGARDISGKPSHTLFGCFLTLISFLFMISIESLTFVNWFVLIFPELCEGCLVVLHQSDNVTPWIYCFML